MLDPWVIPAAKEVYDHRNAILSTWDRIINLLMGQKRAIVFTGLAGAGKTVLFDHLSGAAFNVKYLPPEGASQAIEIGKLPAKKKRIRISVLPGQESTPRLKAINELFFGDKPINGVVHVVANGFIEIRGQEAREVLIEQAGLDTVDKFRTQQLLEEIEDFDGTCDAIRQSAQKHRLPNWMIVCVNKCDLYADDISAAKTYYSIKVDSPFRARLAQLEHQLGGDNFRWSILPVCSWLEGFSWNSTVTKSQLDVSQRNQLLSRVSARLEEYCAE